MAGFKKSLMAGAGLSLIGFGSALADADLVFRYAYDNVDEIRAGLDAFEEQNPGVTVELERIAFKDARDQFIREAATGGGPDIVHLAFVWIKDLGTAEACMELSDIVAEKGIGANGWEDFIASDLTYNAEGDEFYGVPFATDTWGMVYNTEILEEAGVEKIPETWDELLEMARAVKEETGKTGLGFAAGASGANTIWFLANFKWWSEGGSLIVDDENGGYKLGIAPEHVAETIEYWKTYLDEDLTTSGSLGIDAWNAPEILEPMIREESAATIVPVFTAVQMFDDWKARNPGEELPFTTAMTPSGPEGQPTTHLGGQSLCVNANTEHPEEAWALMQWLNSEEFWNNYNTGYFPAQQTLLEKKPFPEGTEGFQRQFTEGARSWGPYASGPAAIATMWNDTSREFGAAFIGEKTPEEAANDLLESIQEELDG